MPETPDTEIRTIDITPTWEDILSVLERLAIGAPEQAAMMPLLKDLHRPLRLVDQWNAENKAARL
jgi:hypothetical protein